MFFISQIRIKLLLKYKISFIFLKCVNYDQQIRFVQNVLRVLLQFICHRHIEIPDLKAIAGTSRLNYLILNCNFIKQVFKGQVFSFLLLNWLK